MLKTYKYKLYDSKKNKHLHKLINISGCIYNHCIALHKRYYRLYKKSLNKYQLQKHLTKLKKLDRYNFWNNLGSQAIQNITERIAEGYNKFFKKKGGLPGFKKVRKYKSFTLKGRVGYKLKDNQIIINKLSYKFWLSRAIDGEIKTVTVKRDSLGDLYICVSIELAQEQENITTGKSVGIDFGLKKFLQLSDNTEVKSPLFHLKNLSKIKALNRNLSKKRKGSNNRKIAKKKLAKLHMQVANQRKDYFHKLSNALASKYDNLIIEDLNMKSMQRLWGRKVSDLGFAEFVNILSYKTNVYKIDRHYPSSKTCSSCNKVNHDINTNLSSLSDRLFSCDCGFEIDRDLNASINIYRVGASALGLGEVRPTV